MQTRGMRGPTYLTPPRSRMPPSPPRTPTMRIAVSLLAFRPGRIGGTETYLRKLLEHLPGEAPADTLIAVMDRDLAAELDTPGFERVIVPKSGGRVVAERILEAFTPWRARAVERIFASLRADV